MFSGCRCTVCASLKCMRRSLLRNAGNAIFGVALVLAACKPVKQVSALGKDIGHEFGRPIMVSVDHRSHLILVVPPADSDTTDPASLARRVAQYAVAHYQGKWSLKSVTVMFDSDSAMTNYTWNADDLSRKSRPVVGTAVVKSD